MALKDLPQQQKAFLCIVVSWTTSFVVVVLLNIESKILPTIIVNLIIANENFIKQISYSIFFFVGLTLFSVANGKAHSILWSIYNMATPHVGTMQSPLNNTYAKIIPLLFLGSDSRAFQLYPFNSGLGPLYYLSCCIIAILAHLE